MPGVMVHGLSGFAMVQHALLRGHENCLGSLTPAMKNGSASPALDTSGSTCLHMALAAIQSCFHSLNDIRTYVNFGSLTQHELQYGFKISQGLSHAHVH